MATIAPVVLNVNTTVACTDVLALSPISAVGPIETEEARQNSLAGMACPETSTQLQMSRPAATRRRAHPRDSRPTRPSRQ